ncbi:MAG TPA: DNA polymerase ligase N-terminal domain-containing protein [Pyrinomonadaceae bacterium]|nr:DNA polymerase ligase N-terminal domain-containing protein [Pyrinomonadaceae bacterium]
MKRRFVIHEHHATNLHFDLRLEIGGVLKSWAVPKGLSLNPNLKRLAIEVPDHSLSYIDFEGTISEGKYGAGAVVVWDNGEYSTNDDPAVQFENGRLNFIFHGKKLRGSFSLLRMKDRKNQWLAIKNRDEFADLNWELKTVLPAKKK